MSAERRYILGVETSCDDTAVAVVDEAGGVLASVIANQASIHVQHGGVFPELASRAHVHAIIPTIAQALANAGIGREQLRAIGVTRGPGLIGSLLVGLNAATGLGLAWNVPVVGVNHLRGHLRSADLEQARVKFPAMILLVSGGHSILARMRDARSIEVLGTTRDDSVGEAYDKVGRMLGLGYPGGPAVDKLAKQGAATIAFPRPLLHEGLDFSFSGLKSAVSRRLAEDPALKHEDVAASFVEACMDVLIAKCRRALKLEPVAALVVVGGVSASPQLRERAKTLCDEMGVELCLPPVRWSTDNAAMIALAAWDYVKLGIAPPVRAETRLKIDAW